ncbi:DUF5131 family protein [Tropicimonas isoalkanivorans]|nr:DUF5131 family protein [Tropicimonas isoalkanivorans]
MTVLKTRISCFDTTWNPAFGCDKVSAGCANCYAEAIARRFHGGFHLRLHPERLTDVRKFGPIQTPDGPLPRRVFVNSMSDLFHEGIPDRFIDQVIDVIAARPRTIFIVLTKRSARMLSYGARRWSEGVPENLWLGVSAENNRAATRIDDLRALRQSVGPFTAYVNVEPLLARVDRHDYGTIDWVGIGGESGPRARPCQAEWVREVIGKAHHGGAAVWFKHWGRWANNPSWREARGRTQKERRHDLETRGLELRPEEQGGATIDGRTCEELTAAYMKMVAALRTDIDMTA